MSEFKIGDHVVYAPPGMALAGRQGTVVRFGVGGFIWVRFYGDTIDSPLWLEYVRPA